MNPFSGADVGNGKVGTLFVLASESLLNLGGDADEDDRHEGEGYDAESDVDDVGNAFEVKPRDRTRDVAMEDGDN